MAKIINFKGNEPVSKQVIDEVIRHLKSIKPENISSIFVSIGLENEEGRGTFLLVRGLDFYDIGYLEAQLSILKLDLMDSHVVGTDPEQSDSFLNQFSPKDDETDE